MKKFILLTLGSLLCFAFLSISVGSDFGFIETAQAACTPEKIADGIPCSDSGFEAPDQNQVNERINEKDFRVQVLKIVNYFLTFLGLFATLAIVYGGVLMVADFGDEENVGKAKNIIIWAGAGIIIVLLSYSFVNWVVQSGDGIDEQLNNGNGTVVEGNDNGVVDENTRYLDEIQGILETIGKLDKNTSDLLKLIQQVEQKQGNYQDEFAKIAANLNQRSTNDDSYYNTIENALDAQGYDASVSESILQKVENGEILTDDDYAKLKTSLQYGLMLQRFETEINILYKSMPKTAVNVAAYNDVITLLTESKSDPSNEVIIQKLKDSFSEFKTVIQNTPAMLARINANPASGSAPLIVTFDGSDSSDPNDQTIPRDNYTWTFFDQDGVERTIGTGPIVEYEFDEPGLYVVYLRVETGMEEGGYKTAMDGVAKVKVKVQPQSSSIRVFINNKEVHSVKKVHIDDAEEGIIFDASESEARVGRRIVEYKWNFGDGAIDFSEEGDAITHSYDTVGQYNARLELRDNTGEVNYKDFKVIVEHLTADIEMSPEDGDTRTTFEMNALQSKSSDFIIQDYQWEIYDEQGKKVEEDDDEKTSFSPDYPGNYKVKLTIKDAEGNTSTDTFILEVKSIEPTASFIAHRKSSSQPATFEFNAASSSDAEDDVLVYSWDFNGDGVFELEDIQQATVEHTYATTGSFKPLLKVTDPFGEDDTLTQVVTVDSLLAVDFNISSTAVQTGQKVSFAPVSPRGESFYWDFGDGNQTSSNNSGIDHVFEQSGNYNVTLTVFDSNDEENKVVKRIFVGDTQSPVAAYQIEVDGKRIFPQTDVCGGDLGIIVNRRNNIKFMGDPSINTDGSRHMLNYTWDFGDGEFGTTKVSSHRYTETTEEGSCFEVTLLVQDRISQATNKTEPLFVQVENIAPTMQKLLLTTLYSDQKEIYTPAEVRLQAQGAYDPDGTVKSYRWWYRNVNDGSETKRGVLQTQQPFATLTLESDGIAGVANEYVFVVEMTDNEDLSVTSEDIAGKGPTISVKNGNVSAPDLDFTMDKNQVFIGDTISFFGQIDGIPEEDEHLLQYSWDFDGDGIFDDTSSGRQVARKFETPGEFEVRLRVKYKGLTSTKKHTVFVDKVSNFPLAAFTIETHDLTLVVDASTSRSDPSLPQDILQYSWDFDRFTDSDGDGENQNDNESSEQKSRYTYDQPGSYFVTLHITDSRGATDTVERKVEIRPGTSTGAIESIQSAREKQTLQIQSASNPITTLDLSVTKNIIDVNESTILRARVLNADGSSYNGIMEFEIIEGVAVLESEMVEAHNGTAQVTITGQEEGDVQIRVTAKNTFYETLDETISIEVQNDTSF